METLVLMGSANTRSTAGYVTVAVAGLGTVYLMRDWIFRAPCSLSPRDVVRVLEDLEVAKNNQETLLRRWKDEVISGGKWEFLKVYDAVSKESTEEVLERYNITMFELDKLLNTYQQDPGVRVAVARCMGSNEGYEDTEEDEGDSIRLPPVSGFDIPLARVVEVHRFMLDKTRELVEEVKTIRDWEWLEPKYINLTVQIMMNAIVERHFGLTSSQVEDAVMAHHIELGTDTAFAMINMETQMALNGLMNWRGKGKGKGRRRRRGSETSRGSRRSRDSRSGGSRPSRGSEDNQG